MTEINFLYLIASGNRDSIYKVGLSVDPAARLRQIQVTYNVPRAYIVETMNVQSRKEAFEIEAAVHARFESRRTRRYGGREFFRLSQEDLAWLKELYRDNTNDFAQAQAYYGLEMAAAELRGKAEVLEEERQRKISHNRRHGKTYNTKPKGALKRYNELKEKIQTSYIGKHFAIQQRSHPCALLSERIKSETSDIITRKTGLGFLKVCAIGALSGVAVGAATGLEATTGLVMAGSTIGLVSGSLSQAMRTSQERQQARSLVESEIDSRYPTMRNSIQIILQDCLSRNSFIIKDFGEHEANLRNRKPVLPHVDLPFSNSIYSLFESKSYFPKAATVITVALTIGLGIRSNGSSPRSVLPDSIQQVSEYTLLADDSEMSPNM